MDTGSGEDKLVAIQVQQGMVQNVADILLKDLPGNEFAELVPSMLAAAGVALDGVTLASLDAEDMCVNEHGRSPQALFDLKTLELFGIVLAGQRLSGEARVQARALVNSNGAMSVQIRSLCAVRGRSLHNNAKAAYSQLSALFSKKDVDLKAVTELASQNYNALKCAVVSVRSAMGANTDEDDAEKANGIVADILSEQADVVKAYCSTFFGASGEDATHALDATDAEQVQPLIREFVDRFCELVVAVLRKFGYFERRLKTLFFHVGAFSEEAKDDIGDTLDWCNEVFGILAQCCPRSTDVLQALKRTEFLGTLRDFKFKEEGDFRNVVRELASLHCAEAAVADQKVQLNAVDCAELPPAMAQAACTFNLTHQKQRVCELVDRFFLHQMPDADPALFTDAYMAVLEEQEDVLPPLAKIYISSLCTFVRARQAADQIQAGKAPSAVECTQVLVSMSAVHEQMSSREKFTEHKGKIIREWGLAVNEECLRHMDDNVLSSFLDECGKIVQVTKDEFPPVFTKPFEWINSNAENSSRTERFKAVESFVGRLEDAASILCTLHDNRVALSSVMEPIAVEPIVKCYDDLKRIRERAREAAIALAHMVACNAVASPPKKGTTAARCKRAKEYIRQYLSVAPTDLNKSVAKMLDEKISSKDESGSAPLASDAASSAGTSKAAAETVCADAKGEKNAPAAKRFKKMKFES